MSNELSLMTLFFRIFNFALLIGIFYYVFNKYVKSSLEEKMSQKESLVKGLEEQGYMLEGKQHELELRLAAQEQKNAQLQERIGEWQTAVRHEHKKDEIEYAIRVHAMNERIQYKNEQIKQDRLTKKVVPLALQRTRLALEQKFSDQESGHRFIENLIAKLENQ
jgi:F0F1-type ATP synthase membrane subunit b/b'